MRAPSGREPHTAWWQMVDGTQERESDGQLTSSRFRPAVAIGLLVAGAMVSGLLFIIDPRLALAFVSACTALIVTIEQPLWGICFLVIGRLTSTGANAWVRIGRINLDLFEPALLLCLGVLVVHATRNRVRVWRDIPWRAPLIGLLGFQLLSVLWCTDVIEAVEEVVGTVIVLCTTLVLVSFIRSARDLRVVLWVWAATSMGIVVLTTLGVFAVEESAFEMAQGSRSGGLGQHPNWFAMNLMFIIHCCLALVLIERQAVVKWLWFVIGTGVFVGQMQSGSRGGTASVLLGGGLAALFHPRVRKIGLIASLPVGVMVVWVILSGSSSSGAFARVWSEGSSVLGASVRESNWLVCWQMFVDTSGLGIGAGGYEAMMGQYDWWLSNSQYTYPHGIFWGLLAHYGVVGVALYVWFLFRLIRMMLQSLKATQGTELQVMAWAMIATMVGYWAWSFFEFKLTDKPFWEFLALFTVFWGLTRNMAGSAKNPKKAT